MLGELWAGVLAAGEMDDPDNPRRPVLDTAIGFDVEIIEADDAGVFARITEVASRTMSHNDRWICAAAIRTRSILITHDVGMAEQLDRYFASLDMVDALQCGIPIICVPRDLEVLAESSLDAATSKIRTTDEIAHLFSRLDAREAEVLPLRFGLDRGVPRTLREVADRLGMKPSRIAQIEKRALDRLRSASDRPRPSALRHQDPAATRPSAGDPDRASAVVRRRLAKSTAPIDDAGDGTNHSEMTDQLLDARPADQPLEFARRGRLGSCDHTAGRDSIQTAV